MKKRGVAWVSYMLATLFFVSLAVMVIIWGRGTTQESAERTVTYVSGKLDCQEVRIDAELLSDVSGCIGINITNKGMLNIEKVLVRYKGPNGEGQDESEAVLVGNPPKGVSVWPEDSPHDEYSLLPVMDVDGELVGCQDKTLTVKCP